MTSTRTNIDVRSAAAVQDLPAALFEPEQLWFRPAGAKSPIQSSIPLFDFDSWVGERGRTPGGVRIWSQMGLLGDREVGLGRKEVVLTFTDEVQELQQWSFVHQGEAIVAVLAAEQMFEVQVVVDGEVVRSWSFENHQPWVPPVTHVALVGSHLALQGTLDHRPWDAQQVLRVYEVASGQLVTEREVFPESPPLPQWSWASPGPDVVERCSQRDEASGECLGERTVRQMSSGVLTITRSWPGTERSSSCELAVRTGPDTEVRLEHQPAYVNVLSRSESELAVRQYGVDCRLVATRSIPASALEVERPHFLQLPLLPRVPASKRGVFFETRPLPDGSCGINCRLQVFELIGGSSTGHNLVEPNSVATGWSDDYIWWAYWNDKDWYVYVVDRQTHEMLFGEMGSHRELSNPITGLKVEDGRVTVQIGSFFAMGRLPEYATRVYDIETGELVASVGAQVP